MSNNSRSVGTAAINNPAGKTAGEDQSADLSDVIFAADYTVIDCRDSLVVINVKKSNDQGAGSFREDMQGGDQAEMLRPTVKSPAYILKPKFSVSQSSTNQQTDPSARAVLSINATAEEGGKLRLQVPNVMVQASKLKQRQQDATAAATIVDEDDRNSEQ